MPESLPVDRVLYEAEAPVVFLTRSIQGLLLLAYVADETTEGTFTLLAPIARQQLVALERGAIPVRDALTASWLWLHISGSANRGLWKIDPADIPNDFLPRPGTTLLPVHEPVLRTRAVGEQVALGRMPASVVAFVADSTRKAMKILLDHIFEVRGEGRPPEEHRTLYDLPILSVAFASFELSFGPPDDGVITREQVQRAARKLEEGLVWAGAGDQTLLYADSDDEREAILRATLALTPPNAGPISEVQISGSWIGHRRVRLTRASRKRVHDELRRVESEQVVRYEGRIGELDSDKLSFILRDTADGQDHRGVFEEELLDDMLALLAERRRVAIAGVERRGSLQVSVIAPVKPDTASE